uniref:C-type lectin domain-containing protein n=1 Tax=Gasterosteus aculeatus aculeatus TaxID=481459 RepID=A0AAQ4RE59_GASAC
VNHRAMLLSTFSGSQCPTGWLARGRSCYSVRRTGLTWTDARHACRGLAAESHLVDLKAVEDLHFISSHLLKTNLLLLWTGLNDQQVPFNKYG